MSLLLHDVLDNKNVFVATAKSLEEFKNYKERRQYNFSDEKP